MNRKEFLIIATQLSIGLPFLGSILTSCGENDPILEDFQPSFNGKVIIVGAGTAGLFSGYILQKFGIDFEIIEASDRIGGRVKKLEGFVDFPIDLGAEWLHTDPSIFAEILNDPTVDGKIDLIDYSPDTYLSWSNGKLRKRNIISNFYAEYKFKSSTWFDFLEQYIAPSVAGKLHLNEAVSTINYNAEKVSLVTNTGKTYEADKVIITVPLTILKQNLINFTPSLPQERIQALSEVDMPAGLKVFIEFSERFYPDMVLATGLSDYLFSDQGEKLYYDAAFQKESSKHVLGLFTVGEITEQYAEMTDEEIITSVMGELDEMFEGKASQCYLQHAVQHWTKEPYIRGSYSHYQNNSAQDTLSQPLQDKLYFAGEAFAPIDTSTVHGAAQSAYTATEFILKGG